MVFPYMYFDEPSHRLIRGYTLFIELLNREISGPLTFVPLDRCYTCLIQHVTAVKRQMNYQKKLQ